VLWFEGGCFEVFFVGRCGVFVPLRGGENAIAAQKVRGGRGQSKLLLTLAHFGPYYGYAIGRRRYLGVVCWDRKQRQMLAIADQSCVDDAVAIAALFYGKNSQRYWIGT